MQILNKSEIVSNSEFSSIIFEFNNDCKILVDTSLRILSYVNQLSSTGKNVTLDFKEEEDHTFSYLNRIGFFDFLDNNIVVKPDRPAISGADLYRGENQRVFEITKIIPSLKRNEIPGNLTDKLLENIDNFTGIKAFEIATFTILGELIDNIHIHSESQLDGYVAMQVYKKKGTVKVSVIDSGMGLLSTLRPALEANYPQYANCSDPELIIKVFSEGLSRNGIEKGNGLKSCAFHALKFDAELDLLLPKTQFHLTPISNIGYNHAAKAIVEDSKVKIAGTQITFVFKLDNT